MCRTAHRADGDRGAVIPIVALSLITLMVMTAFSIDIGRQILRRREAQAVADVIALDMSRLIDGRNVQSIEGDIKWSTTKSQSATRNNWSDSDVEAVTGHWDAASGAFTRLSGTAVPDAVQVTARDIVDFYFGTVIGASHGNVSRSSVALPSGKTFGGLGSVFAGFQYYRDGISAQYDLQAELRTKVLNATFSQQFGFSSSLPPIGIGLDAVGYKGISNGNVRLGDMAAAAGFGSVDEMLNADMTAKDLLNAEATALQNSGNSSDVAAGNEIATFSNSASSTNHVRMGDFIDVSQGGPANAANYSMNALALMQAAGQLMNGQNFFSTTIATNIPGVPTLPIKVAIIEGMRWQDGRQGNGPCNADGFGLGCGPHTSQVRFSTSIPLTLDLTPYGVPLVQATSIPLVFESAKATSLFTRVSCGEPPPTSSVDYQVFTNGVAGHIGTVTDSALRAAGTLTLQTGALLTGTVSLGFPPVTINLGTTTTVKESKTFKAGAIYNGDLAANANVLGAVETHTFVGNLPDNILPTSWRYAGGVGNTSISTTLFNNLGITNPVLNAAISSALKSQLADLDNLLIDPVLSSLGVTIAGADGRIGNTVCSPQLVN